MAARNCSHKNKRYTIKLAKRQRHKRNKHVLRVVTALKVAEITIIWMFHGLHRGCVHHRNHGNVVFS